MPRSRTRSKAQAGDDTFRVALGDQGDGRRDVSLIRSKVLWVGVSMDRYWRYSRLWLLVLPLLPFTIAALLAIPIVVQRQFDNWWFTAGVWLLVLTPVDYLRMFTARAMTSAAVTNDTEAWSIIASFPHRDIGMVSVGLKAVAFVNETYA